MNSRYNLRRKLIIQVSILLAVLLSLIGFNNCSISEINKGFYVKPADIQDTTGTNPKSLIKETRVYLGGTGSFIQPLKINHSTDVVTLLPQTAVAAGQVGWLSYDSNINHLMAVDASAQLKEVDAQFDMNTGIVTPVGQSMLIAQGVHSTFVRGTNQNYLYVASYNSARLDSYLVSNNASSLTPLGQIVTFTAGAKTHSSAFDSKRNPLFVSNLGLNQISIYSVDLTTGLLTFISNFSVDSPRTVIYDEFFDKLYLATESTVGNSFILGYSILKSPTLVTLTEVARLAMPLVGADIKIDHSHQFAIATAREAGQESFLGLPLKADGSSDNSRASFRVNVNRVQPRSLEITEDGNYAIVAMNSATVSNIQVYKLEYDAASNFIRAQIIFDDLIGPGYLCSYSLPISD